MSKTPKLRFKEFSEDWEENELGNIVEISKAKYNPLKSEKNYKCIELENLSQETGQLLGYFNSKDQQSIKNKFNKGQVLFGKLRPYLKKYWLSEFEGVCSSEIWVLNGKSVSNNFIYRIVQTNKFNFISNISSGSKMPRADWSYMSEFPFFTPGIKEQEKIASFFSLIDEKISLQGEKVEALKDYKKGMMQKIFSREFRFKGFNNPWKVSKAKDLFDSISDKNHNGDLEVLSATQDKGIIPRSELDIDIKFEKGNLKSYKKVNKSDFIISLRSFQGGIEHSKYTGLVSPAYTVFNFKEGIDFNHDFFAIIFKRRDFINRLNTLTYGIRDGKAISFKDFSDVKLEYPEIEEQEKIAYFFSIVDKKINKEQEKLDFLNEYKRGLLQQMFI